MNRDKKIGSIIVNVIFGVIMAAVLVCQFLPFWTVNGQSASLLDVSARQYDQFGGALPVIRGLDKILGGFTHHDVATQVLLTIVFSAIGTLLAFTGQNGFIKLACAVACVGFGAWLFFAVPAFTMGIMGYVVLGAEAAALLTGVVVLLDYLKNRK